MYMLCIKKCNHIHDLRSGHYQPSIVWWHLCGVLRIQPYHRILYSVLWLYEYTRMTHGLEVVKHNTKGLRTQPSRVIGNRWHDQISQNPKFAFRAMPFSKSNQRSKLFSVSNQAQAHSLHDQICGRWWLYLPCRPSLPNHQFSANDLCSSGALKRSGPRTWSQRFQGSKFHAMFPLDVIAVIALQTLSLYLTSAEKICETGIGLILQQRGMMRGDSLLHKEVVTVAGFWNRWESHFSPVLIKIP